MDSDASPRALERLTHGSKNSVSPLRPPSGKLSGPHLHLPSAAGFQGLARAFPRGFLREASDMKIHRRRFTVSCSGEKSVIAGPQAMAGLRCGRPTCIRVAFSSASTRAGFRKRQRNTLHRFKANHKKNHMDLIEGIWREFLDPFDGDSEDPPGHPASSHSDCSPGDANGTGPSHARGCGSPGEVSVEDRLSSKTADLPLRAASRGPTSLEANDVDMQPAEASSPEARGRATRRSGSPEDWRMTEDPWPRAAGPLLPAAGPPEPCRPLQGRSRATRPPPRLGGEKDKGPKLTLSKRKLELLLAEPEKNKRKKQYVA